MPGMLAVLIPPHRSLFGARRPPLFGPDSPVRRPAGWVRRPKCPAWSTPCAYPNQFIYDSQPAPLVPTAQCGAAREADRRAKQPKDLPDIKQP